MTFFRKIWGVQLKLDTAAYYTNFYCRDFNCFQNWLCIIIFNWIFKNLWDFDQKLRNLTFFLHPPSVSTDTDNLPNFGHWESVLGLWESILNFWESMLGIWESILDLQKLILGFMVNFGLLGSTFRALGVDPEPLGVDICSLRVNLVPLGGASRSQIWAPGSWFWTSMNRILVFAINFGLMTSMLGLL